MSPLSRSLHWFRTRGYSVAIAEYYSTYTKRRHDLFGFIDMVALGPGEIIGVQVTSSSNVSARTKKIEASAEAKAWLRAGGKIVVQGWALRGAKGKRKLWTLSEREIYGE